MLLACGVAVFAAVCGGPVFPELPPAERPPTRLIALGGGHPGKLALSERAVWVTVYGGPGRSRVVAIDRASGRVRARIPVRGSPFHVAVAGGAVWVTGNDTKRDDVLQRIDPATRQVVATVQLPGWYAGPIAADRRGVWVLTTSREVTRQWLVRVDAGANRVARRLPLGAVNPYFIEGLDLARGFVWLLATRVGPVDQLPGDVLRFDRRAKRVTARIKAGALQMEAGPGGMWVSACVDCRGRRRGSFAQRVGLRARRVLGPRIALRDVGAGPLFVGKRAVWFGGYDGVERTVAFSIDPQAGLIDRFLLITPLPHSGMAFDPDQRALWVSRAAGGVFRVDLAQR